MRVPQIVDPDVRHAGLLDDAFESALDVVREERRPVVVGEDEPLIFPDWTESHALRLLSRTVTFQDVDPSLGRVITRRLAWSWLPGMTVPSPRAAPVAARPSVSGRRRRSPPTAAQALRPADPGEDHRFEERAPVAGRDRGSGQPARSPDCRIALLWRRPALKPMTDVPPHVAHLNAPVRAPGSSAYGRAGWFAPLLLVQRGSSEVLQVRPGELLDRHGSEPSG